jgi:hypothetical protein
MQQRWRARWIEDGKPREFVFVSGKSLMLARIDFKLKFGYDFIGRRVPEHYELEEDINVGAKWTPPRSRSGW